MCGFHLWMAAAVLAWAKAANHAILRDPYAHLTTDDHVALDAWLATYQGTVE